jgi:thiosulfate/3-mercaptopyruvate sulfurtransferase
VSAYRTLLSVADLAAHLEYQDWLVFDCRHDLADPAAGRKAFSEGHVPGARFMHLDEDLSGRVTGRNGRHPLPEREEFARRLAALGVSAQSQVVVCDDGPGMFAARLWWMLRWMGHTKVAVLDGGLAAWRAAGLPLSTAERHAPRAAPLAADGLPPVTVDQLQAQIGRGGMLLVDARAAERFRGEDETLDPVGGHIPGAVNRPFRLNLNPDGRFKAAQALRAEWSALLAGRAPEQVIHSCGSGVTACHNLLAMEHAELSGSRLYAGSWSEWCADPARQVARGEA